MTARPPSRGPLAALAVILLLAGGLRLYLAWCAHVPTLDTAVVGQMALDILDGGRPAFFAGQSYLGALEAYLTAAVFAVLPAGRVTMTLAPIAFALLWIAATFGFFRREYGGWAAVAAALVPAFPGWPAAWYTTAPYGGYPETYFFGLVLLGLALPFGLSDRFRPTPRHALALAATAGIALWVNLQVLPCLAAAGLAGILAWRRRPVPLRPWLVYLVVPVAVVAAFLPQFLAEPSHVEPPLFAGGSLAAAARSVRALIRHDLAYSVLWTYPPALLHRLTAVGLALLAAGGLWLGFRRRPLAAGRTTTRLVAVTLAVFALTYFPHPMSGFVPRYLIAPVTLLLGWCLVQWCTAPARWMRRAGFAFALLLAVYNAGGMVRAARARAPEARQTLAEFSGVIDAARAGGWDAVLHAGSETEGYDGARLTFLSRSRPVFASAFSDRFLEHQLAWEFGGRGAWLAPRRHLPFLAGSYAAVNVPLGEFREAPRYVLLDAPDVPRRLERSRRPDSVDGWPGPVEAHPLFDRASGAAWPESAGEDGLALTLRFDKPARLAGLRACAPHAAGLPSRYAVRVQTPDGRWIAVQECERRIGASWLSGTRLYFRGHHPWMDIRFDPVDALALEWAIPPGPGAPPQLDELMALESSGEAWPADIRLLPHVEELLAEAPGARLIAERGILRLLHREAEGRDGIPPLPLPYNPRFSRTQPDVQPLTAGRYLLVIEEAYLEDARAVFHRAGIRIEEERIAAPFCLLAVTVEPAASGQTAWQGFRPVRTSPP